jgi:hypothetical protein
VYFFEDLSKNSQRWKDAIEKTQGGAPDASSNGKDEKKK